MYKTSDVIAKERILLGGKVREDRIERNVCDEDDEKKRGKEENQEKLKYLSSLGPPSISKEMKYQAQLLFKV